MHIVHLYHRNTTHITSTQSIHLCTETLTEALNQESVKICIDAHSECLRSDRKDAFFSVIDLVTFLDV